jgi:hypothetical protein
MTHDEVSPEDQSQKRQILSDVATTGGGGGDRSSTCLLGKLGVLTTSPSSSSKPLKVVI